MKYNRIKTALIVICILLFTRLAWSQIPAGPYLGQQFPGTVPEQFAPGLLPEFTSSITFTPEGLECFTTRWYPGSWSFMMTTKELNGSWSAFDTASFTVDMDELPYLTPDGNRLYFICYKPVPPSPYYIRHLWYADRVDTGWSEPVVMDSPIKEHYVISVSAASNGNLYLAIDDNNDPAIYISKLVNGNYQEPEKLNDSINYLNRPLRAFIAPDESYILFDAGETPDPFSQRDVHISYRNADETWSKAVALDETVNTGATEVVTFVSRDNQLIFFSRETNQFWKDASNILTNITDHAEFGNVPKLSQNYPNPFSGNTTINFYLPQPSFVTMGIYDMMNKEITSLVDEERSSGNHEVSFDAGNLPEGLYVYILRTENSVLTRKMLLIP